MAAWYYAQNNQQFGPHDEASISNLIRNGTISPVDLVWREGMAGWVELQTVPEFSAVTSSLQPVTGGVHSPPLPPSGFAPTSGYAPDPGYATAAPVVGYAGYNPLQPNLPAGMAIASMVLGIVSVVFFCAWYLAIPCAILAVIFSAIAKGKVRAGVGGGAGMAKAGMILGIIGICLPLTLVLIILIAAAA